MALSHFSPRSPNEITALGGGEGDKGGGDRLESAGFFHRSPPRYEGVRVCVFFEFVLYIIHNLHILYIYIYTYMYVCIHIYTRV